jgi:chromosome segregation ATPase
MYEAGARVAEFSSQAKVANKQRCEDDRQSRFDSVMNKKESKIQSLKQQVRALKESNSRHEEDQRQSQIIIDELRVLVDTFQSRLDETRHTLIEMNQTRHQSDSTVNQKELDRYRTEVAVLTRALAVSAVETNTDGDVAISQAQQSLELEQLRSENERLRCMEAEMLAAQIRLREEDRLRNTLVEERVQGDAYRRKIETLERFQETLIQDRERSNSRCTELEETVGNLRSEHRMVLAQKDERISMLMQQTSELSQAVTSIEVSEKKQRQRVQELELILAQREASESSLRNEADTLRVSIAELDVEIRSLASSLTAETEANENLVNRLNRLELEKEKQGKELVIAQRREKDLRNDLEELVACKAELDQIRRMVFHLQNEVADRDSKIASLEQSRQLIRENMSLEIGRLSDEVSQMASTSASLSARYSQLERERDKIKSQLASETMTRLALLRPR